MEEDFLEGGRWGSENEVVGRVRGLRVVGKGVACHEGVFRGAGKRMASYEGGLQEAGKGGGYHEWGRLGAGKGGARHEGRNCGVGKGGAYHEVGLRGAGKGGVCCGAGKVLICLDQAGEKEAGSRERGKKMKEMEAAWWEGRALMVEPQLFETEPPPYGELQIEVRVVPLPVHLDYVGPPRGVSRGRILGGSYVHSGRSLGVPYSARKTRIILA